MKKFIAFVMLFVAINCLFQNLAMGSLAKATNYNALITSQAVFKSGSIYIYSIRRIWEAVSELFSIWRVSEFHWFCPQPAYSSYILSPVLQKKFGFSWICEMGE